MREPERSSLVNRTLNHKQLLKASGSAAKPSTVMRQASTLACQIGSIQVGGQRNDEN